MPIAWYGLLFAGSFLVGFYLLRRLFRIDCALHTSWTLPLILETSTLFCERILLYVGIGAVSGARLFHLLFYERWERYLERPLLIFNVREGGLASHGAVVGIFIALALFYLRSKRGFPFLTMRKMIDLMVLPTLIGAVLIRIGNFFNQEVLGVVTTLPFAITFGHPIDGAPPLPRHPAQLYEALAYLLIALALFPQFKRAIAYRGRLSGLFFLSVFAVRFLIEYVKEEQSALFESAWITMGQLLSLPFIALGVWLLAAVRREEGAASTV